MKKMISVLCCLLLTTIMVSCAYTSNSGNSTEKEQLQEKPKDHVIYYYPSAGKLTENEQESTDVTFKDAETKTFSFAERTKIDKPQDTDDQRSFELNGKTYSLEYRGTYKTALSSSNNLKNYSLFNYYRSDNGSDAVWAYTRVGTNELLMFVIYKENELIVPGDLTKDGAKTIAESTFLSLYGDKMHFLIKNY